MELWRTHRASGKREKGGLLRCAARYLFVVGKYLLHVRECFAPLGERVRCAAFHERLKRLFVEVFVLDALYEVGKRCIGATLGALADNRIRNFLSEIFY